MFRRRCPQLRPPSPGGVSRADEPRCHIIRAMLTGPALRYIRDLYRIGRRWAIFFAGVREPPHTGAPGPLTT